MPDQHQTVRRIAWRDLFPWVILFRCWGLSLSVPLLLLATLAVLVSPIGSWIGSWLFFPAETRQVVLASEGGYWPGSLAVSNYQLPQSLAELGGPAAARGDLVVRKFMRGWQHLLTPPGTLNEIAYVTLGALWSLVVWGLAAGAITRVAVMQLGCDRRLPVPQALRFVLQRFQSYLAAPLIPLAPLLLALIALGIVGWIGQSGFGLLLVGLAWPIVLVAGAVLTILFLGLVLGWPLMWVALGAETDADAFEAISRGYTYALQRPLRLIGYAVVALFVGLVGWVVVFHVSEILLALVTSGLHPLVILGTPEALAETGFLFRLGAWFIHLGNGLVRTIAVAYGYSFFFCAAAAIYLMLRRDIDEAQFDQVHDEQDEVEPLDLPPLPADVLPSKSAEAMNAPQRGDETRGDETREESPEATSSENEPPPAGDENSDSKAQS